MPKRLNTMKAVCKEETLTLNCEWDSCDFMFVEMGGFMDHITMHLQLPISNSKLQNGLTLNDDEQFTCFWRECSHEPFSEYSCLVRHVYFHAFHIKLKSQGMVMILKNNLRSCLLDSSARNLIPDIPERFSCGWQHCSGVFDNPELFYRHIANHCEAYPSGNHIQGGCACQWDGCVMVTKSKHKLKDHLRAHTQEKLAACPTCGALFCNMSRLYDHLKRQLESEGHSYQCSHCSKKYATERLLKEHMRHHVNHFQCPFCDMTCPTPSNLKLHFRYRHSAARPYICDQCQHTSKTQHDLRRHQETHKTWMHCEVEDCGFRCHAVANLNRHYKLKHEFTEGQGCHRFQCHLCSSCYMAGNKLTSHLRKKHKFKWPPGHVRFRYKYHNDGFYRLQTVRYESIELTQQILATDITGEMDTIATTSVQHGNDGEEGNQAECSQPGTRQMGTTREMGVGPSGLKQTEINQSENSHINAVQPGFGQYENNQARKNQVNLSQSEQRPLEIDEIVPHQSENSHSHQPADIYEDIVIKDREVPDDQAVDYSYNLDLLGDMALRDSSLSQDNIKTPTGTEIQDTGKAREGKISISQVQVETPATGKKGFGGKTKRKRLSMETGSEKKQMKRCRITFDKQILDASEDLNGKDQGVLYHSTPIKQFRDLQVNKTDFKQSNVQEVITMNDRQQSYRDPDVPGSVHYDQGALVDRINTLPLSSDNHLGADSPRSELTQDQVMSVSPLSEHTYVTTPSSIRMMSTTPKVISIEPQHAVLRHSRGRKSTSVLSNPITISPIPDVGPVISIIPQPENKQPMTAVSGCETISIQRIPDYSLTQAPFALRGGISIEQTQAQFEGLIPLESININTFEYMNSSDTATFAELHPVLSHQTVNEIPPLPHVKPTIHGVTMMKANQHINQTSVSHGNMVSVPTGCPADRSVELDPEIHSDLKAAVSDLESSSGLDSE